MIVYKRNLRMRWRNAWWKHKQAEIITEHQQIFTQPLRRRRNKYITRTQQRNGESGSKWGKYPISRLLVQNDTGYIRSHCIIPEIHIKLTRTREFHQHVRINSILFKFVVVEYISAREPYSNRLQEAPQTQQQRERERKKLSTRALNPPKNSPEKRFDDRRAGFVKGDH